MIDIGPCFEGGRDEGLQETRGGGTDEHKCPDRRGRNIPGESQPIVWASFIKDRLPQGATLRDLP